MPEMVKLEEMYANDSITFIHISYDTDREKWWNYVTESGMQGLQFCEMKKINAAARPMGTDSHSSQGRALPHLVLVL